MESLNGAAVRERSLVSSREQAQCRHIETTSARFSPATSGLSSPGADTPAIGLLKTGEQTRAEVYCLLPIRFRYSQPAGRSLQIPAVELTMHLKAGSFFELNEGDCPNYLYSCDQQ